VDTVRADRELDRMIERRASRETDADEREELWQESVRRYEARVGEENRVARVEFHQGQAVRLRAVLENLISHHETQVAKLCQPAEDRENGGWPVEPTM
jgi:hypothetical protein